MSNIANITAVKKMEENSELIGYLLTDNNIPMHVPKDEANTDYQRIQEWAAIDGNNIEEAD
tara:strand:+ start:1218 stop:1400 length:183 start_codon:yes stop_codon:yes gene_type:complete